MSKSRTVKEILYTKLIKLTPARIIVLGFVVFILAGALVLMLPVSTESGISTGFTDALFTSVSSVCITGLVILDTSTHWSLFGKGVILLLVQIGALGIMSIAAVLSFFTGKEPGLNHRIAMKETLSNFSLQNIVSVFKRILAVTLIIEGIGALLISIVLIPVYGPVEGLLKSIFHSVSAFCNAGFDVFGTDTSPFVSLTGFKSNFLMLFITALLVIVGGLGFIVWNDIAENRKFVRLTLHSKIVILSTLVLLGGGTLGFLFLEYNNTLADFPLHIKLLNAFFHSVSSRSAGFNTLPLHQMSEASDLLTIIFVFIGAAPGSTGGGIKVTTLFVLMLSVLTFLRGRQEMQVFKRRIDMDVMGKAISIFIVSLVVVLVSTLVMLLHREGDLGEVLFEAVSAFGTAGMSKGITPELEPISKYQLMVAMLVGRIGTLTAISAFTALQGREKIAYRYPEGKITLG